MAWFIQGEVFGNSRIEREGAEREPRESRIVAATEGVVLAIREARDLWKWWVERIK